MSGKGSNRRPTQISEEEAEANWQRIFGKHKESKPIEDSQKDRQNGSEIKTASPRGHTQ
jgi:hypothetical protein